MTFTDALASTIHDIKNSLGMIVNVLDELTDGSGSDCAGDPRAKVLQLEARRANNDLVQLLTLYKSENGRLVVNPVEHNLDEFLEELVIDHRSLAAALGIRMEYQCDPWLSACFDEDLLRGVLNDAIGNAERYTRDRLLLNAAEEDGYVAIRVEDNGEGFPQEMLDCDFGQSPSNGFNGGRTRLGLYFSEKVARLHHNQERQGRIGLRNRHRLDGGCFSIWLP